jgi:hypothetical protein
VLLSIQSMLGGETFCRTLCGSTFSSSSPLTLTLLTHAHDTDPNIDSPLNGHAASLWENQVDFKKHLLHHYEQEVRSKEAK